MHGRDAKNRYIIRNDHTRPAGPKLIGSFTLSAYFSSRSILKTRAERWSVVIAISKVKFLSLFEKIIKTLFLTSL